MNFLPKIIYNDGSADITIQFTLAPDGDFLKEKFISSLNVSQSYSGKEQAIWAFNEKTINPNMTFVSQSIKDSYETFFLNHGSKGKSFKYYISGDEPEFSTVTLDKKDFSPKILFPGNTLGEFVWEFSIAMRELL